MLLAAGAKALGEAGQQLLWQAVEGNQMGILRMLLAAGASFVSQPRDD